LWIVILGVAAADRARFEGGRLVDRRPSTVDEDMYASRGNSMPSAAFAQVRTVELRGLEPLTL
jgi:hypothetical protein